MTEDQAKKQLRKMLQSFTAGSVLHLLADLYRQSAAEARRENSPESYRRFRRIEEAMFVVGLGIDALSAIGVQNGHRRSFKKDATTTPEGPR